jgi:2-polyprenyl-3-methyl-5-hydroxy-6-metoxy-1,4-benzoquinol methylase
MGGIGAKGNEMYEEAWWDSFWRDSTHSFGAPTETLISYAKILKNNHSQITAIDVGSGNGRYAVPLAKLGYKTSAIEIAQSGINRILEYAKKENVSVNVEKADFVDVCGEKRKYDLVLSSGLIEVIPKQHQVKAIEGLISWVKPGGVIILKYCNEIGDVGEVVKVDALKLFTAHKKLRILHFDFDRQLRQTKSRLGFWNTIRTTTIVAEKL